MKILSILTYYHPHWTGLTAFARRIAEGLAARGHEVTVLTTRHDRALPATEVRAGVRIVRMRPTAFVSRGAVLPSFPFRAASLIRRHDVVQIHTPLFESALVARLCRAFGRPMLMTHHGDLVMPAGLGNRFVERVVVSQMSAAARATPWISTLSADYAAHSDFLRPFASRVRAITPPVEMPVPQQAETASWRSTLGLADRKVIGFAGRFVEEKGFDYLLQALPALVDAEPRIHLVYAGDHRVVYERFYDRCRPLLEQHAGRITFLGLLRDSQQLANFYALCDVFALPSRSDCFASVQVEAMLSGTPVVAADIPGAREVVQRTGMGRLVRARDPGSLAEGLLEVLHAPDRFVRPRGAIQAVFDPDRAISEYEEVLRAMVTAASPAMSRDADALARILRNDADPANRRRVETVREYLDLQPRDVVLDCGCGLGWHLKVIGELSDARLHGIDVSPERLARARREVHGRTQLALGRIEALPYREGSFAKAILSEVLEHLADDRAGLLEVRRVVRRGEIVAITVPNRNYPFWWDPINALRERVGLPPIRRGALGGIWTDHVRLYSRHDIVRLVRQADLVVEDVRSFVHYCVPFAHNLVYGVGKALVEHGVAPRADRFRYADNRRSRIDPLTWALGAIDGIDRLNVTSAPEGQSTVCICVKARKA